MLWSTTGCVFITVHLFFLFHTRLGRLPCPAQMCGYCRCIPYSSMCIYIYAVQTSHTHVGLACRR